MNACASLYSMKTEYDAEVEYMEDNQNVSIPCIQLVMTLNKGRFSLLVHGGFYGNRFVHHIFVWPVHLNNIHRSKEYNVLYQKLWFFEDMHYCFNFNHLTVVGALKRPEGVQFFKILQKN